MLHQCDQDVPHGGRISRVAQHHRDHRIQVQSLAHLLHRMPRHPVEAVDGDQERGAPLFEIVDGGKAVGQPSGVGENHLADGTERQLVPQETKPVLTRSTEQIQDQVVIKGVRPKSIVTVVVDFPSTPRRRRS